MNKQYIGIFDSGVGGISVLNHCLEIMPNENYIYLGDSKNSPFGLKSHEELTVIIDQIMNKLIKYDLKAVVIACNTISVNHFEYIQNKYKNIKIIGTFPSIESVFLNKTTLREDKISFSLKPKNLIINRHRKKLLLIATSVTCKSEYVNIQQKEYSKFIDIFIEPADRIVKFVENNEENSFAIKNYLEDLFKEYSDIDYLVLGCTHFPFAINAIRPFIKDDTIIIDNCAISANNMLNYLLKTNNLSTFDTSIIKIIDTTLDETRRKLYESKLKIKNATCEISYSDIL